MSRPICSRRLLGWTKFLVELIGDLLHGTVAWRRGPKRKILAIHLKRELAVVQILVGHDGEIEQGGAVTRLLTQRRLELLRSFLVATPLYLHQAKAIPGLR